MQVSILYEARAVRPRDGRRAHCTPDNSRARPDQLGTVDGSAHTIGLATFDCQEQAGAAGRQAFTQGSSRALCGREHAGDVCGSKPQCLARPSTCNKINVLNDDTCVCIHTTNIQHQ